MKFEGRFEIGNNHAGKGDRLSRHWDYNKVSEGLRKVFGTGTKNTQPCAKCGDELVEGHYHVVYEASGKLILCTRCKNKRLRV